MAWKCGIVGLPNAGKSTLFKALTGRHVVIESYPFATIDPNKALVYLPDARLEALAGFSEASKTTYAGLEVIDVAGLVQGASRGEGLGNQFLGHLRDVDLLIHVVGAFAEEQFLAEKAVADLEVVATELIFADLEVVRRRQEKLERKLKSEEREAVARELGFLQLLEEQLLRGFAARDIKVADNMKHYFDHLALLTLKDIIYVCNTHENTDSDVCVLPGYTPVFSICAGLEAELVDFPREERASFMELYGFKESRAAQLLVKCYDLLDLATFYTIKGQETKAWLVEKGTTAWQAAGLVHSDMQQGFINAEVFAWDLLLEKGSLAAAREKGWGRVEGKDYTVKDGDILFIRFR